MPSKVSKDVCNAHHDKHIKHLWQVTPSSWPLTQSLFITKLFMRGYELSHLYLASPGEMFLSGRLFIGSLEMVAALRMSYWQMAAADTVRVTYSQSADLVISH